MEKKTIDKIKIALMVGLIATMATLAIVIWKYGGLIIEDPCKYCNCDFNILKGGIK